MSQSSRSVAERVGERMKRSRRKAGLSVEFMAEHFGRSVDTIRSWEQSRHQPRGMVECLQEWARLTDVPYGWLITGDVRLFPYPDGLSVVGHNPRLAFKLPPASVDVDLIAVEDKEKAGHEPTHRRPSRVVRAS